MRMMRKVAGCAAALVLMTGMATYVFAQKTQPWNGGGTITNPKGGGVSGVEVTLADTKTPGTIISTTTTDSAGNFSFKNLSHDIGYRVTPVAKKGGYAFSPAYGGINWTHTRANFTAK